MRKTLCFCLVVTLCLCLCSCKSSDYKKAVALYEAGEYEQAIAAFKKVTAGPAAENAKAALAELNK